MTTLATPRSHFTLPSNSHESAASPAPTVSDTAHDDSAIEHRPKSVLWQSVRVALVITAVLALAAAIISIVVLGGALAAIGAFTVFSLMLFISMPLLLATIGDVIESHE